ncbi:MAG: thioesterase, partial [Dinoroseobacter sp.]|nr:thioesterase [Dinoroseobacter sp.]
MGERTEALDAAEKRRIAKQFIEALPFAHSLKMEVQDIGEGVAVIAMPWSDDLVGDPRTGVIHGGAVSALMDTCGGAAVMTHPEAPAGTA